MGQLPRPRRLVLWVVGAREAFEGELVRQGWLLGPLLSLDTRARDLGLEIVLIGPEMRTWELGVRAADAAGTHRVRAVGGTLHAAINDGVLGTAPDATILFHSGIGAHVHVPATSRPRPGHAPATPRPRP